MPMTERAKRIAVFVALLTVTVVPRVTGAASARALKLTPRHVSLSGGRSFDLNLPAGLGISVAAQGLRRVRFLAKSPDDRIFVTGMYDLSDNTKGAVYILDPFDAESRSFRNVIPYLTGLRNPNSIAFYTDGAGASWLYLALTDRLLRYRYRAGDNAPAEKPEVLATFPDYGLSYKYGGWHLTRTVVIGGNGKIYVSVGSSCNACEEKEEVRASVLEMDPDGQHSRSFARGLRNAVGMRWIDGRLFATDMGSDHLGDHKPADTFYILADGANYGWPYCFQSGPRVYPDGKLNAGGKKMSCKKVPRAYTAFDAHSSPLGFESFGQQAPAGLAGSFLVALHGSTKKRLGHGYRLARVDGPGAPPVDFVTGFLRAGKVYGRPADVLSFGPGGFLFTDDAAGVVYYVYENGKGGI
jgi:glucose/arabinose dehydrogenase